MGFLNNYRTAVNANNRADLSYIVERWKSTSKIVGIRELHDHLNSIELALERDDAFDYHKQYESIQTICD
jgi:hypothetical protein